MVLIVGGCNLAAPDRAVLLVMPEPAQIWTDCWGEPQYRVEIAGRTIGSFAPGQAVEVRLNAGTAVGILAYPEWGRPPCDSFYPAGAVWPFAAVDDADGRVERWGRAMVVRLSYQDGPIAMLVVRMHQAGIPAVRWNLARLRDEVRGRASDDPWMIDWQRVVEAIGADAMRANYLDPVDPPTASVELPPGIWVSPNPFAAPLIGTVDLAYGYHRLYGVGGERLSLDVGRLTTTLRSSPACPE